MEKTRREKMLEIVKEHGEEMEEISRETGVPISHLIELRMKGYVVIKL